MEKGKLNPYAFGVSLSVLSSLSVFVAILMAQLFLHGKPLVAGIGTIYMTYEPTFMSAIYSGVLALINGFIGGFAFSWVYNKVTDYF